MPVFTRLRDDVLTLTVDGDYTANELRRVAIAAFGSEETPSRFPILLDMSGAAGVMSKSDDEMKAAGLSAREVQELMEKLHAPSIPDFELDLSRMVDADTMAEKMYEAVPSSFD